MTKKNQKQIRDKKLLQKQIKDKFNKMIMYLFINIIIIFRKIIIMILKIMDIKQIIIMTVITITITIMMTKKNIWGGVVNKLFNFKY